MDIGDCLVTAKDIAVEAGKTIVKAFHERKSVETKDTFADLVTETDKAVEKMIMSALQKKYPSHKFIGEETTADGQQNTFTDEPTWIVDPIDGTNNFVHRFPYSAVAMALAVKKEIVVGVVYNPMLNQMFTARRGMGAYCNDEKLEVSKVKALNQALLCTEYGSDRNAERTGVKMNNIRAVIDQSHGIRSLGSAALNMCMVASGGADGYWEYGIHAWDYAASALIVQEAGGVVLSPDGGPLDILARRVLCASTKALADQMVPLLKTVEYTRD